MILLLALLACDPSPPLVADGECVTDFKSGEPRWLDPDCPCSDRMDRVSAWLPTITCRPDQTAEITTTPGSVDLIVCRCTETP